MKYYQVSFYPVTVEQAEILIASLSESGFEGFEEADQTLHAFVTEDKWNEESLINDLGNQQITFSVSTIEETNWNEVWESNFSPVIVDDFVAIRAEFHEPIINVQHEIVITPKMSFGTGHHATTFMMMKEMRNIDFTNKDVFDFGTGTGVLAILAEKLGGKKILAIDNDDWSIANAKENLQRNECKRIELAKMNEPVGSRAFGVILANINKHIILENLPALADALRPAGNLLLSGLLVEDESDILYAARPLGLVLKARGEKLNWLILRLSSE